MRLQLILMLPFNLVELGATDFGYHYIYIVLCHLYNDVITQMTRLIRVISFGLAT